MTFGEEAVSDLAPAAKVIVLLKLVVISDLVIISDDVPEASCLQDSIMYSVPGA